MPCAPRAVPRAGRRTAGSSWRHWLAGPTQNVLAWPVAPRPPGCEAPAAAGSAMPPPPPAGSAAAADARSAARSRWSVRSSRRSERLSRLFRLQLLQAILLAAVAVVVRHRSAARSAARLRCSVRNSRRSARLSRPFDCNCCRRSDGADAVVVGWLVLRVLPLGALQRAELAPFGAAQPAPRLQLLQARVLRGCEWLLRSGAGCAARRGRPGLHILLTPLDAACGPRRRRGALDGGGRTRGGSGDSRRRTRRRGNPGRHVWRGRTGDGRSGAGHRRRPGHAAGAGDATRARDGPGARAGSGRGRGAGAAAAGAAFLGAGAADASTDAAPSSKGLNACRKPTPDRTIVLQLPRRH